MLTRRKMLFMILGALSIGFIGQIPIAHAESQSNEAFKEFMARIEKADPASDLQEALKQGDKRFIGIQGAALVVPGVDDYFDKYQSTNGVFLLEGAGSSSDDPDTMRLNAIAFNYALKYNNQLLVVIRSERVE